MFGYERSEIIGKSVLELAAPRSRDLVQQHIRAGFEGSYEAIGLRKDGATFIGELVGRSMQYQGRQARVTAIRDITRASWQRTPCVPRRTRSARPRSGTGDCTKV